ncbi:MAG: hypothetical protein QG635_1765 [Bacteroidota bacterium]|nr:hypothetical protein [Bacteroidota bacterium]
MSFIYKYFSILSIIFIINIIVCSAAEKNQDKNPIKALAPKLTTLPLDKNTICNSTTFTVRYQTDADFDPANFFTTQLSDKNGKFDNPIDIGSEMGVRTGSLIARVPFEFTGDNFRIRVKASDPETFGTDNGSDIKIIQSPQANIISSTLVCEGSLSNFSANTPEGINCYWSVTNGTIQGTSTSPSLTVMWNSSGSGSVKLVQSSSAGCSDSISRTITIQKLPLISLTGLSKVCKWDTASYFTESESGMVYEWSISGGEIFGEASDNSVSILWGKNSSGTARLIVRNATTGCSDSASFSVEIFTLGDSAITGKTSAMVNETADYSVSISAGSSAQWSLSSGGEFIGTSAGSPVQIKWTLEGSHTITVIAANENLCSDTNSLEVNILPTDVKEFPDNSYVISLNPNPAKSYIDIIYTGEKPSPVILKLYDIYGRLISEKYENLSEFSNRIRFNLDRISIGLYFISVEAGNARYTQKILKIE